MPPSRSLRFARTLALLTGTLGPVAACGDAVTPGEDAQVDTSPSVGIDVPRSFPDAEDVLVGAADAPQNPDTGVTAPPDASDGPDASAPVGISVPPDAFVGADVPPAPDGDR